MRIETLTRMSGQIAANCAGLTDDQAIARISEHLRAFWTPAMLDQLHEYDVAHPGDLDPRVSTAIDLIGV
ncbi:MAG: formate dehydrogenase subunit delta [Candidatus Nanopelagicales bacterium]